MNKTTFIKKYRTGHITRGAAIIADLYEVPVNEEMADKYNICRSMTEQAVWHIRVNDEDMRIFYETVPKSFRYPVLKEAVGEIYTDAIADINNTAKGEAA